MHYEVPHYINFCCPLLIHFLNSKYYTMLYLLFMLHLLMLSVVKIIQRRMVGYTMNT
jgi:hypothetical protein